MILELLKDKIKISKYNINICKIYLFKYIFTIIKDYLNIPSLINYNEIERKNSIIIYIYKLISKNENNFKKINVNK